MFFSSWHKTHGSVRIGLSSKELTLSPRPTTQPHPTPIKAESDGPGGKWKETKMEAKLTQQGLKWTGTRTGQRTPVWREHTYFLSISVASCLNKVKDDGHCFPDVELVSDIFCPRWFLFLLLFLCCLSLCFYFSCEANGLQLHRLICLNQSRSSIQNVCEQRIWKSISTALAFKVLSTVSARTKCCSHCDPTSGFS